MISHCLVSSVFTPGVRILRKGRSYVLGRDPNCEFPLPSEIVSRRHAEVRWEDAAGGRFVLRDLGSRNGTLVGGVHVSEHVLRDGDTIWIGPFHLQYREYDGDITELLEEASDDFDATVSLPREALTAPTISRGFKGRFTGDELMEICQLIGFNEKEGVLHVRGSTHTGELSFWGGFVVRAECGPLRGERAALQLLSLPEGSFEFLAGPCGQHIVRLPVENLLMEAARRRDEQQTEADS
ncbi:MAG: FHA domain-containing protein [Planctomycetota bacterium]|nr:MAG: FHA domain-containing protein [Planctomycetota bacterium]